MVYCVLQPISWITRKCGEDQRDGCPSRWCCHLSNATHLLMPVLWIMPVGGWVRTLALFLTVCGPKYTKLSVPVRECSWFAKPFSDWQYLVFRRYLCSSREVIRNRARISCIWAAKFRGEGRPRFQTEFHKSGFTGEHVAKFGDDRPSDVGD